MLGRPRVHRVLWFTLWSAARGDRWSPCCSACRSRSCCTGCASRAGGLLRAFVLVPFVLPTVVVGVAFRTLLAVVGPARAACGLDGTPAAIVAALVFFNLAVVVRTVGVALGGPRPPPRGGRRRAGRLAAAGAAHGHPARAAARHRLGRQRGVPVLRDRVRRRADPGRAALRHRRDRDLPAHHPVPRPAGRRPRCRCCSSSWSACCCSAPSGPGPRASTPWTAPRHATPPGRPRRRDAAGARGHRAGPGLRRRPAAHPGASARCGSATPGGWSTTATSAHHRRSGERAAGAGVHRAGELLAGRGRRHPARDAARRAGRRGRLAPPAGPLRATRRWRCSTRCSCCRSGSPR